MVHSDNTNIVFTKLHFGTSLRSQIDAMIHEGHRHADNAGHPSKADIYSDYFDPVGRHAIRNPYNFSKFINEF